MKFALILFLALRFADKDFIRGDIGKLSQYSLDDILKIFNCFHFINYLPALLGCLFVVLNRDMGTFMVIAAFIFL